MSKFTDAVKKAKTLYKTGKFKTFADAVKAAYKGATKPSIGPVKRKRISALPIGFTGNFLGYRFKVMNQYNIDGTVSCQLWEIDPPGRIVGELNGRKQDIDKAITSLTNGAVSTWARNQNSPLSDKDLNQFKNKVKLFVTGLSKEVVSFNSGKDTKTTKGKNLEIKHTPSIKKQGTITKIKSILISDKKIMPGGYALKPGKLKKIGSVINETLLNQYKAANQRQQYFEGHLETLKKKLSIEGKDRGIRQSIKRDMTQLRSVIASIKKEKSALKRDIK